MKKLLMLCLIGMAAAVMAAEIPVEFKTKKDLLCWGNKKYYETVNVSVEENVAKISVEKIVPDAKPLVYQLSVRNKRAFKAGVNYQLTLTLKSNQDVRVKYLVQQVGKPYKKIGGITAEAELAANEPQTLALRFSVKEDVEEPTRLPTIQAILKEGQTLELSDVKLAEEKVAVLKESPIEIKTKKDLTFWANKKYYESTNVTVEEGVAKVTVEKVVPDAKAAMVQLGVRNKSVFKAGVNYKLAFTVKSNQDAKMRYFVQLLGKPYKNICGASSEAELTADEPQTLALRFSVKEDLEAPTRAPSLYITMKEGQTLELSDVKLIEEEVSK